MIDPLFGEKGGERGKTKKHGKHGKCLSGGMSGGFEGGKGGWAVNRAGNHPSFLIRSFLYGKPNRKYFLEYVAYLDLR